MNGLMSDNVYHVTRMELIHIKDVLLNILEGASVEDVAGDIEEAIEIIDSLLYKEEITNE